MPAAGTQSDECRTFPVGQGLLWFLEGVLSQKGLGGLQHRVDERPARLHLLHERLYRDGKEKVSQPGSVGTAPRSKSALKKKTKQS